MESGDEEAVAPETLATVAVAAAEAPADHLRREFRDGRVEGDYGVDDVKTAVDREAEAMVRDVVEDHYPDHAFHGEEVGHLGDGEYTWLVDPLDGTNNFASGIPTFATAVTVLREEDPVAAAVHEPLPDTTYRVARGAGATVDGEPIPDAGSDVALDAGTVSLVIGLSAIRDPEKKALARRVEAAIDRRAKRVLKTWAPCVDWGLLATGRIEGIVCVYPDAYEQAPGELLAAETDVVHRADDRMYVGAGDGGTLAALCDALPVTPERTR